MTDATPSSISVPQPPQAAQRPVSATHHGDTRTDPYEWLRDKDSEEVLEHLRAENAYAEEITQDQAPLRQAIFDEIKARTVETDLSVPMRERGWWYYTRTEEGKQYGIQARVRAQDTGDEDVDWTPPDLQPGEAAPGEQILIDGNALAQGESFFALGGAEVSRDGNLLAYAVDTQGDERFTLYLKDLTTGELLPDRIENTFYGPLITPDATRVIYTVVDATWRPHQLRVHTIGTDPAQDTVLLQEDDPGMWLGAAPSPDGEDLVISAGNAEYAHTWLWEGMKEGTEPVTVVDRKLRTLHSVAPADIDGERRLLILHDLDDPDASLSMAPLTGGDPAGWTTVLAAHAGTKLDSFDVVGEHLVVQVREDTTPAVWLLPTRELGTAEQRAITRVLAAEAAAGAFAPPGQVEEAGTAQGEGRQVPDAAASGIPLAITYAGASFESPVARIHVQGDLLPTQVWDVELSDAEGRLLKTTPVRDVDLSLYRVHREWAQAQDGTRIPLTVLHHKDVTNDGTAPLIVYGYGSYEISNDPGFGVRTLSTLDRGAVFAVAHVRGGGELGRQWYLDGKKLSKKNSFTDFVDATRWLTDHGWGDPERVGALGGSAGGLLMGAVANLAPERYAAIVAQVPFVDPLTSILDPDLPLSALEWEEWGNPIEDAETYFYMKSYSPYENVSDRPYPLIAARTSLHDTRVLYVEPAKWVQELRNHTTSGKPVVMTVEMEGGHGGASGRYERWKDRAWDDAFLLSAIGATEPIG